MIEIKIKDMIDDAGAILPVDGLSPNATEMLRKVASSLQCPVDIALSAMFATVGVAMGKRVIIDIEITHAFGSVWLPPRAVTSLRL